MSATSDFYRVRAEQAGLEADKAVLDNVRDRARRSQTAWQAMADRLTNAEDMRALQLAEKAALPDLDAA